MNILYVEDNAVNLSLIERIAQMNQHKLVSYEEAEVALKKLEEGLDVDLILLDIQLAGEMDGIGFAKEVRKRGWTYPIIAITAFAMMGDKERILEAGCNDYLPKPLPIAEFLTLLAKYDPANRPKDAPAHKPSAEAASTTPAAETPATAAPTEEPKPATTSSQDPPKKEEPKPATASSQATPTPAADDPHEQPTQKVVPVTEQQVKAASEEKSASEGKTS